ncbi:hypothetical protein GCM10018980_40530 [Streptomyces capoamus]|uniref:Uncharacterized protein n=1 Tax=Streptomyces capoamus TaxID=68183 RepID=A0A919EX97_9ACTN|nr:hypothetical protein [Streptomyces capoamus]GGW15073.1 hypothetical protein GCM10010501_25630 [Streptomyces libani subsp. rufus]GHG55219.1 hypothetical protein GCM10018980_40530 [Streptomyces capoamus]
MSVLEFISSLKWPVVVLVIGLTAMVQLRRSPVARSSIIAWFKGRNFRMRVAGQEFETTIPSPLDMVDNMTTAASGDAQLAARSPRERGTPAEDNEPRGGTAPVETELTGLRRSAVEAVMRDAAQWGWQMAQMGFHSPPDPEVQWTEDGTPQIMFGAGSSGRLRVVVDDEEWLRLQQRVRALRWRGK